jgi:hypothetical protein
LLVFAFFGETEEIPESTYNIAALPLRLRSKRPRFFEKSMTSILRQAVSDGAPRQAAQLLVDCQEISGASGGSVEVTDHRARITERLNSIAKRQAPDDDGRRTLAMGPVTTCDTCPYACRTSFRHGNNASGLMCVHDIHRFSSSRFPRDNAESA